MLFDLLTREEQESDIRTLRIIHKLPGVTLNKFNIELLTERLDAVTQWVQNNNTKNLKIGYFGASTGAAASLYAASSFRDVKAVVSRGGRTDLVDKKTLEDVKCPCLFIVGGNDKKVIEINKKTINQLTNVKVKKLDVIQGATHLFEEEGKIEEVGRDGEAMNLFNKALTSNPNHAPALYNKALLFDQMGRTDEAYDLKQRAAAIDPTYEGDFVNILATSQSFA